MTAAPEVAGSTTAASVDRRYGFSAMLSGLARLGRAPLTFLVAIVLNAVVQGLLILPGTVPGTSLLSWVLALVSYVVLLLFAAVVTAAALGAATQRVSPGSAVAGARAHLGPFALWAVGLTVAVMVGLALWTVPGLVVVALTPYLLLAASDGRRNPLGSNVRAIAARPWRWLVTVIVMGLVLFVSWLFSALSGFFVQGFVSSSVTWLWFGLLYAWFTTTWALLFRSTPAGSPAA